MDWIYLSPHLDDVALSCGGLVWEQGQRGKAIAIWTICAGDPPGDAHSPFAESLHARWAAGPQAVVNRRSEDIVSCRRLRSIPRHFSIPDAIYRRSPSGGAPLYASDEALFGELSPEEEGLVAALRGKLQQALPPQVQLVCPLGIGGHVDHRLVRAAAESLNRRLWYYADYPYVVRSENRRGAVEGDLYQDPLLTNDAPPSGSNPVVFPVSERGLQAWVDAVAAHASQIGSFWPRLAAMESDLRAYREEVGGVRLWGDDPAILANQIGLC